MSVQTPAPRPLDRGLPTVAGGTAACPLTAVEPIHPAARPTPGSGAR